MGQLRLQGPDAAAAFETLMPVDVCDLPVGQQRYGLLLNDDGGIIDDLMFFRESSESFFVVVNGACKAGDIAHIQARIGYRCQVTPLPELALLALQGPLAVQALARLTPGVEKLVFMRGGSFMLTIPDTATEKIPATITRSGYTGEDGFEISLHQDYAVTLARALLAQPEVQPIGLGARNSLRLEAGLCLYGQDMDIQTTPVEASLAWAISKVRRTAGARAGGFPGASKILAALAPSTGDVAHTSQNSTKKRVGLVALERIPVREGVELQTLEGQRIGSVTSGLLSPSLGKPVAMGYVEASLAGSGQRMQAIVRGKPVPMEVCPLPFVPHRYIRG